jgi:hypothetical protein
VAGAVASGWLIVGLFIGNEYEVELRNGVTSFKVRETRVTGVVAMFASVSVSLVAFD